MYLTHYNSITIFQFYSLQLHILIISFSCYTYTLVCYSLISLFDTIQCNYVVCKCCDPPTLLYCCAMSPIEFDILAAINCGELVTSFTFISLPKLNGITMTLSLLLKKVNCAIESG